MGELFKKLDAFQGPKAHATSKKDLHDAEQWRNPALSKSRRRYL
jgi:hypothetical protein